MTFRLVLILVAAVALHGQDANSKAELLTLTDDIETAAKSGDWRKAAELSSTLKRKITELRNQAVSSHSRDDIDTIFKWMPEDTETAVVASEPFELRASDDKVQPSAEPMSVFYVLNLLSIPGDGEWFKPLQGRTLRFAIVAARKFGLHTDDGSRTIPLGMIAYEGCGFYVFAQPVSESVFSNPAQTSVMGQTVWVAEGKDYSQARDARPTTNTYIMTLLKPDLILACNSDGFFRQVISRMATPSAAQAFPATLPEWKYVDRSKPVWALRHYRPERAEQDPSFPRVGNILGGFDVASPIGITLGVDGPDGKVVGHLLAAPQDNPWKELVNAGDFHGRAETAQVAPGVWTISAPADVEAGYFAVFALMGMLGFVVLV